MSMSFIFFDDPSNFYKFIFQATAPATYPYFGPEKINNNQFSYYPIAFDFGRRPCVGSRCPNTCLTQIYCGYLGGSFINETCFLCGFEQIYLNGNCENKNYCGANQIHNGYLCVCANYYVNVSGSCEPACGLNAYTNREGVCTCISPICTKGKTCRINEFQKDTSCYCNLGYLPLDGKCELGFNCPKDYIWNFATVNCEPCSKNNKCGASKCPPSSTWNGTACVCADELYLSAGACIPCPSGSMWMQGECICLMVTQYFSNGQCLSCPPKTRWNGKACA